MRVKINKKIVKYLDFTRGLKELRIMKVTVILIKIGALGTVTNGLEKRLEEFSVRGRINIVLEHSPIEIILNSEKSPGDLRRYAVT